jgi:thiamine-monophosphate kinase
MKEKEFIEIIKSILGTGYIGDDCAHLRDLGIVITQDSLVEDVHFTMDTTTPYKLGWKTVMVNISDVCASGAEPKYLTIGLSGVLDVKEFCRGAKDAADKCSAQIVGGDLTGGEKIFISAAAIGSTQGRRIASRAGAKAGHKIIVSGEHGNSAAGLRLLSRMSPRTCSGVSEVPQQVRDDKLIDAHLMPVAQVEFSRQIATQVQEDYAMMDTSDGLADALWQISQASNVLMAVEFDKIPHRVERDLVLYGGEDYQLVACVPEKLSHLGTVIGEVRGGKCIGQTDACGKHRGVEIDSQPITDIENRLYDHFS